MNFPGRAEAHRRVPTSPLRAPARIHSCRGPPLPCTHESRVASSPFDPRQRPWASVFSDGPVVLETEAGLIRIMPVAASTFPRQNPVPPSKSVAMPLQYRLKFRILRLRTGLDGFELPGTAVGHGAGITASRRPRDLDEVIDIGIPGVNRPRERANGVCMPASVRPGIPNYCVGQAPMRRRMSL